MSNPRYFITKKIVLIFSNPYNVTVFHHFYVALVSFTLSFDISLKILLEQISQSSVFDFTFSRLAIHFPFFFLFCWSTKGRLSLHDLLSYTSWAQVVNFLTSTRTYHLFLACLFLHYILVRSIFAFQTKSRPTVDVVANWFIYQLFGHSIIFIVHQVL